MAGNDIDLSNLSNDPEELAAVFAQLENGDVPKPADPAPSEPPAEQPKDAKTDPVPAQDGKQEDKQGQTEPEPEGVATKDGRNVIPYGVLKSERERASRAEQLAKEMQDRVAALEEMVKTVNQGAKQGESARTDQQTPNVDQLSPEDLEALKEDFPTVYKAVMASMAAAKALEAKLEPVERSVQEDATERARSATETVQEAIDSVPKMAHIQASDAAAFDLAKQFDATLRTQAAWADKPLSERFAKVIEMVESAIGQIDVPGSKPPPQPSTEDLKKAAQAKAALAAKATRTNVPNSLSEFPVGDPAAQDEREAAENMSALQLADKFASMTPDQMDAYFRTL